MATRKTDDRLVLLQGTLDMLVLKVLLQGPQHGHGIACAIHQRSDEVLLVDHGSLYPSLQRLEEKGLISAKWGVSDNNRRARFYSLTRTGRAKVVHGANEWRRFAAAITRILGPNRA